MNWLDILSMGAPLAASAIGTPAAGIAVGAGMNALKSGMQGGGWADMAKNAALGAGMGAAGGALSGAFSGAGNAAGAAGPTIDAALAADPATALGQNLATNMPQIPGVNMADPMRQLASSAPKSPGFFQNLTHGMDSAAQQMQRYGNYAAMAQTGANMLGMGGAPQMQPPQLPGGVSAPPLFDPMGQLSTSMIQPAYGVGRRPMGSGPMY